MSEELKPCPWCGPLKVTATHTSGNLFRCGCEKCGMEWTRPTYAEAVAGWNRRASDARKSDKFDEKARNACLCAQCRKNDPSIPADCSAFRIRQAMREAVAEELLSAANEGNCRREHGGKWEDFEDWLRVRALGLRGER